MAELNVCRTERVNPAQSIAFDQKGFDRNCTQKLKMLTNFLLYFLLNVITGNMFVNVTVK